ncbi:MAG TPA: ABC transporter permease [Chloroflexota bacterium]|nr:ABC transporter permease [Chloroflexota bacterium]
MRKGVPSAGAGPALGEIDAADPVARSGGARPSWSLDPLGLLERYGILALWVIVIVVFGLLTPSTFLTFANFQTILGTQAVLLFITLGLLIPLTAGEFDLSVANTMNFGAVMVGYLNVNAGWPLLPAITGALACGLLVGAANALLVVTVGVPSLVATLGTGTLIYGLGYGITNSTTIGGISQNLINASTSQVIGLPLTFFYGIALCAILWYVFDFTPLGRYLVFVGEGREVARLSGLRVDAIRAGALIACALVATIAGVLQDGVVGAATPDAGPSYLLPAFAGAFLGQTAINPGRFNPWGTTVAVYFLVTGITGLELLGQGGWVQDVFYGGSLILAVTFGRLAAKRRAATG